MEPSDAGESDEYQRDEPELALLSHRKGRAGSPTMHFPR